MSRKDNIKLTSIFVVCLFVFTIITPFVSSNKINTGINDVTYFELSTEEKNIFYERGFRLGRENKFYYKFINIFSNFIEKKEQLKLSMANSIESLEKYSPYFLEELNGLSASVKIPVTRLLEIQVILSKILGKYCTVTLSTGPATKFNETFLTQNWDFGGKMIDTIISVIINRVLVVKKWVADSNTTSLRYSYIYWGIPVLWEYPILNEKGVGWGAAAIPYSTNESVAIDTGPGMSSYNLLRLAFMTCKNVTEIGNLYRNTERASGEKYGLGAHAFCDAKDGILMIEASHNYIATVYGSSTEITQTPEGILWHINHQQWIDPASTGARLYDECQGSIMVAERAKELLIQHYGNITLDVCKEICRDYEGGFDKTKRDQGDICMHPDKDNFGVTIFSYIINPKELTVYWTKRIPCYSKYIEYDFSDKFT